MAKYCLFFDSIAISIVENIIHLKLCSFRIDIPNKMEVRTRSSSNHRGSGWHEGEDEYDKSCVKEKARVDTLWNNSGNCPTLKQQIRRETWEMTRVMTTLVQGRASKLTYLLIPAMISILWVLICLFTTRQPSISIEERLSQQHYRVSFL